MTKLPPRKPPTVLRVMGDLFGAVFRGDSWAAWRVALAALFALPLPDIGESLVLYQRCTGRKHLPSEPAREAWWIIGRRGGKSRVAAFVAVFIACFVKHPLAPGEIGTVMVIASDRRQSRICLRYVMALLRAVPMLARQIVAETKESVELRSGIVIEVHSASFRSTRGYTVLALIADEIAYWPTDDAAEPDSEILAAVRPGMATVPGALLLAISSPYARRGELWNAYQRHWGRDGDPVQCWQADSATMNPTLNARVVQAAYDEDEARASAEFGALFRRDIEALFAAAALEAATQAGRLELPPAAGLTYKAFVDPSGGSGTDSMTLGIAHADASGRRVLDLLRERRPPFSPEACVAEFAEVLRAYGIAQVTGDRFGGEWPRERFQKQGITYEVSAKTKSELYAELLPLVNSGKTELLDHERLLRQMARLERRTARGGKDLIDHAPGGHDDLSNVAAGALLLAQPSVDMLAALQDGVAVSDDLTPLTVADSFPSLTDGERDSPWTFTR